MEKGIYKRFMVFALVTVMMFTAMPFSVIAKAAERDETPWWHKLNGARMFFFNDPGMAAAGVQNTFAEIEKQIPELYAKGYRIISLYGFYESDPGDYSMSPNNTYSGLAPIDYYAPESSAGTMEEFESMVAKAHEYGMKVMAWINLGYSYEKHDYWIKAQEDKRDGIDSPEARSFFWSDTDLGGDSGWDWEESKIAPGWYYKKVWHHPAYNWASPDWQNEVKKILKFWHDKGIDGWILDNGSGLEQNNNATAEIIKECIGDVCAEAGVLVISEGDHTDPAQALERNFSGVYDNIGNSSTHDSFNIATQCINRGRTDQIIGNKGSTYMTIEEHLAQKGDIMRANGGITFSYDPESGIDDSLRPLEIALATSLGVIYEMYFSRDWDVEGEMGGPPRDYANTAEMENVLRAVNSTPALEPGGSRMNLPNDKAPTVYSFVKTSMDGKKKALCIFNFANENSTVTIDLTGSGISTNQTPINLITNEDYETPITSNNYTVTLSPRSFLLLSVESEVPEKASITPEKVEFDKNPNNPNYADIRVILSPGSYTLSSIRCGTSILQEGTDYVVNESTYTIKKEYLATLGVGIQTITFDMSSGNDPVLTVTISDTSQTKHAILEAFATFDGNGNRFARIDADSNKFLRLLYDGKVIEPDNYTVEADGSNTIITLKESYLKTFANGIYNFRAEFTDGYADLTITVARISNPKTNDAVNIILWYIMLATSVIGTFCMSVWYKRR